MSPHTQLKPLLIRDEQKRVYAIENRTVSAMTQLPSIALLELSASDKNLGAITETPCKDCGANEEKTHSKDNWVERHFQFSCTTPLAGSIVENRATPPLF